jgi:Domain of unknown function (DUF4276)
MTDIVVLAEEPSAQIIAECLAQKLNLAERVLCLRHQGKSDLEQSIPRKVGHWRAQTPPRFVVMRDNDGADCLALRARLLELVPQNARPRVKIRLVVQELESWYLGDLDAVSRAGLLSEVERDSLNRKAILRNPDRIGNAKQIFKSRVGSGGQIALARSIGPHLSVKDNRSRSFHAFIDALHWAANPPIGA